MQFPDPVGRTAGKFWSVRRMTVLPSPPSAPPPPPPQNRVFPGASRTFPRDWVKAHRGDVHFSHIFLVDRPADSIVACVEKASAVCASLCSSSSPKSRRCILDRASSHNGLVGVPGHRVGLRWQRWGWHERRFDHRRHLPEVGRNVRTGTCMSCVCGGGGSGREGWSGHGGGRRHPARRPWDGGTGIAWHTGGISITCG